MRESLGESVVCARVGSISYAEEDACVSSSQGLVREFRVEYCACASALYQDMRECNVPRHDLDLGALCKKKKTLGRCAKTERTAVFVKARALPGTFAQVSALVCARA